jgi:hypothetical protein
MVLKLPSGVLMYSIKTKYDHWLMHRRLRRCYRMICDFNLTPFTAQGYEQFLQDMEGAYRESPEFFAR